MHSKGGTLIRKSSNRLFLNYLHKRSLQQKFRIYQNQLTFSVFVKKSKRFFLLELNLECTSSMTVSYKNEPILNKSIK